MAGECSGHRVAVTCVIHTDRVKLPTELQQVQPGIENCTIPCFQGQIFSRNLQSPRLSALQCGYSSGCTMSCYQEFQFRTKWFYSPNEFQDSAVQHPFRKPRHNNTKVACHEWRCPPINNKMHYSGKSLRMKISDILK